MKKVESFGSCKDGKPHIIKRDEFWRDFAIKFKEGERFRILIEKLYSKRSNQQNRYYWGVILPILLNEINEQGNDETKDTLHELLISMFAEKKQMHNSNGEIIERPQRTKEMNKSQFSDYSNEVVNWASSFWGCYIPEPGTQTKLL